MGEAFICRRGGSTPSDTVAAISADYPAGSVCTCTNGDKQLDAADDSGKTLFLLPYEGNWIVACEKSGQRAQKTVYAERACAYNVALGYAVDLLPYWPSRYAECDSWEEKSIVSNSVDITDYKTLYFSTRGGNLSNLYIRQDGAVLRTVGAVDANNVAVDVSGITGAVTMRIDIFGGGPTVGGSILLTEMHAE